MKDSSWSLNGAQGSEKVCFDVDTDVKYSTVLIFSDAVSAISFVVRDIFSDAVSAISLVVRGIRPYFVFPCVPVTKSCFLRCGFRNRSVGARRRLD